MNKFFSQNHPFGWFWYYFACLSHSLEHRSHVLDAPVDEECYVWATPAQPCWEAIERRAEDVVTAGSGW